MERHEPSGPGTVTRSRTEILNRLREAFTSLDSSTCPGQSASELATAIQSGVSGREEAGDCCHGNELSCVCLTLMEKMVSNSHSETPELSSYCRELLRVLFSDVDLMSSLVRLFQSEDPIISHLAAKTTSSYVSYQLHTCGAVNQVWQQVCDKSFLSSPPSSGLDACMWSLTSVLKGLVKGGHRDLSLVVVETFDSGLCVLCSRFLPLEQESVPMTEDSSCWSTTFGILLNLLEVLSSSASPRPPGVRLRSQRLTHVHGPSLLRTVTRCPRYHVKKAALLLLKRVLLQKPGDDWLTAPGVRRSRPCRDTCALAQGVMRAVATGWLLTVEVRAGSFFGGTCQRSEQKKDCVMLRAVSVILLKAAQVYVQDPLVEGPGVEKVCGLLQTLWDFLRQQSVQMQEVLHSCCLPSLLFVEQDDDLMEAAAALLAIFLHYRTSIGEDPRDEACVFGFNPHCAFLLLLRSVSFDHSILLDFLISMETCFLEYLVRYLKYLLSDWDGFVRACRRSSAEASEGATRSRVSGQTGRRGPDPGVRLVEYGSSEESDEDHMEVESCDTLTRALDCLSRLRDVVTRLNTKQLFPYNPASLLRLLALVGGQ